jgi:hypothetical protein
MKPLVKAITTGAVLTTLVASLFTACSGKPANTSTQPMVTTVSVPTNTATAVPTTSVVPSPISSLENRISIQPGNAMITNIYNPSMANLQKWKDSKFKYIYLDIGGINPDTQRLQVNYSSLEAFMSVVRDFESKTGYNFVVLPWNVVTAEGSGEPTAAKFASKEFRENYFSDIISIIQKYDFEGWLVDVEAPLPENRTDLIQICKDIKAKFPNKILAFYAGSIAEDGRSNWTMPLSYVKGQIAPIVDMINPQGYDFFFQTDDAYKAHLKSQLDNYSGEWPCAVMLSAPAHKADNPLTERAVPQGNPETLANALEVFKSYIGKKPFVGISVIWDFDMCNAEWRTWDKFVGKN